ESTPPHSPVLRRATQTTKHTLIHTPKGNLEKPINLTVMFLDCGRKLEYPERTHACTGENMQTPCRKTPAGKRTQHLFATRPQCYQLCSPITFQFRSIQFLFI
ncbi:hypothetical protein AMECASPLE_006483, partial [Ameca splendens]